jgi:hypothetical protein
MQITAQVTCFGPGGAERTETITKDVPAPGPGTLRDWANDHLVDLYPMVFSDQTGTKLLITACADRPDLVDRQFDWNW